MNIKLTEQQLNNLFAFLERVDYKGLKEAVAINEIINSLNETENKK